MEEHTLPKTSILNIFILLDTKMHPNEETKRQYDGPYMGKRKDITRVVQHEPLRYQNPKTH